VKGATVIHPGAASEARRWPAERWAEVARAEHEDGRAVFVTGARCELALAGAVAAAAGLAPDRVLAGRTDVRELAAIVGSAACVLCGDTGVGHLASALGTPSVLLFGPVSPQEWGPTGACERRHVAIWHGHRGDPHAAVPDPGLLEIGVGEVLEAVDGLERERPRLRAA
jgi:ADP-heptose:LPS heptosyltransferase